MILSYLPVELGPPRADPICFVLVTAYAHHHKNFLFSRIPTLNGGVFSTTDPEQAGSLFHIAARSPRMGNAVMGIIGAGWTQHRVPFSSIQVSNLSAAVRPGDAWAAIVYPLSSPYPIATSTVQRRYGSPSVPSEPSASPSAPIVVYGVAPFVADTTYETMSIEEACSRSSVFFRYLITTSTMG